MFHVGALSCGATYRCRVIARPPLAMRAVAWTECDESPDEIDERRESKPLGTALSDLQVEDTCLSPEGLSLQTTTARL